MKTWVFPRSMRTSTETTRARRGKRSRSWMSWSRLSRPATRSSCASAGWCSSELNSASRWVGRVGHGRAPFAGAGIASQAQHRERAALEPIVVAGSLRRQMAAPSQSQVSSTGSPERAGLVGGQHERHRLVMGVEEDQEGVAHDGLAMSSTSSMAWPERRRPRLRLPLSGHSSSVIS